MKKKLLSFFLALVLLSTTARAVDLYVDTNKIDTDTPPTVVDGRTLVPVRAIFEAIGATVTWDADTRTATGIRGDIIVSVQIDNTIAYVNGEPRVLDVPAQIINGRTMVPARFISESMGCDVTWYQPTQTVGVANATKGQHIYVTATGKRYHYSGTCNGGTYYEATLAEAMGRGLTPCDKCVLTNANPPTDTSAGSEIPGNYTATVLRVVDGDTFVVNYNGVEETVRLIGVDTPESVHPDSSKNTDAGFAASEFTTVYLTGKEVELEFDVQQRDQYGRLLAYAYLDGEMFNEKLLKTGYANIATYPPNVKYVDRFIEIVNKRDPSIPSGEYYDGYMKAPKVIYNATGDTNGVEGAFLYEDGVISEIGTYLDSDYMVLSAENGFIYIISFTHGSFASLHGGDFIRVGFLYLGNTASSNSVAATYLETLEIFNESSDSDVPSPAENDSSSDSWNDVVKKSGTYVGSLNSDKYHNPSCRYAKNIEYENQIWFDTISEAHAKGYSPCGVCHPR